LRLRGVCYDVGRVMLGEDWRPNYDPRIASRELEIITNDLHCNSVRVQGLNIDRLLTASEIALELGLEAWISPEMWDRTQDETIEYLKKAACAAEEIRGRFPYKVVFSLGSELTLFMQGIVEGKNVFERMSSPSFLTSIRTGAHNANLNSFLARANEAVKDRFHGPVTYFSLPFEAVDWTLFDFVGVDHYRDARIADSYGKMVERYVSAYKKPVVIGEFGCCTYRGAEKLGGQGFMIAFGMMQDYLGPIKNMPPNASEMLSALPRVDGHYIRDEALQAREVVDQLGALDSVGVDGAFVFTFVSPNSTYNEDPRFDGDMGSYSLVKSYPEAATSPERIRQIQKTARDLAGIELTPEQLGKFTGEVGKHGATYPDMTWEPKESFRAVADFYANNRLAKPHETT
jgi:hypothetical protein